MSCVNGGQEAVLDQGPHEAFITVNQSIVSFI